jgi:ATP-dependent exoDNAse (exonuclease V) beta subunit
MGTYNQSQLKAIESLDNHIVIKAPPGSGKTLTMVGAIEHYMKNMNQHNLVAMTFTVKATEELQAHFPLSNNKLTIATIHSWSYQQLEKLSKQYNFKIRLLQEEAILDMIRPMLAARNIQKTALQKAYYFLMSNQTMSLSDVLKKKLQLVKEDYNDFKRARHMYDFTDLPLYLYTKLVDYNETITDVDALFIDEFQDIDPVQLKVFDLVRAQKRFYIGDPDQSIYLFRGACTEVFDNLQDFTTYELEINYRSYQEILDFASTMKKMADDGVINYIGKLDYVDRSHIKAERGFGGAVICINPPAMINYTTHVDYYDPVIAVRNELKLPYHILCRTNNEVKKLQELGYSFVSTIHQAKGLEYDNVTVIDFELSSEEEINIAYVALTRAKNRLLITDIATIEKAKNNNGLKGGDYNEGY